MTRSPPADTLAALGAKSLRREDCLVLAIPLIVQAMETQGPHRIIVLASAEALFTALDIAWNYPPS